MPKFVGPSLLSDNWKEAYEPWRTKRLDFFFRPPNGTRGNGRHTKKARPSFLFFFGGGVYTRAHFFVERGSSLGVVEAKGGRLDKLQVSFHYASGNPKGAKGEGQLLTV